MQRAGMGHTPQGPVLGNFPPELIQVFNLLPALTGTGVDALFRCTMDFTYRRQLGKNRASHRPDVLFTEKPRDTNIRLSCKPAADFIRWHIRFCLTHCTEPFCLRHLAL